MKDIVDRLYSQGHNDLMAEAAEEIERLRQAIKYEDNRFARIGTHGPDCYTWGPKHYECALAKIERLQASDEMLDECCSDLDRVAAEKEHYIKVWSDVCDENQGLLNKIERLKAKLEAETQRRWDGNRIASNEAAEELAEVKKYWSETHANLATCQAERDAWENACSHWENETIASQAREAALRELLTQFELWESYDDPETPIKDELARIGSDDTALQEAIKQAKKEAAEHILEMWRDPWPRTERRFIDRLEEYVGGLE